MVWLEQQHRPIVCTEYMARSAGSTFDGVLPTAKKHQVGAINWDWAGKTQTTLSGSRNHPYVLDQPPVWFHDVFRADGTRTGSTRRIDPAVDGQDGCRRAVRYAQNDAFH